MATISELHDRLSRREISASELLDQQLARIEEQEPRVHAYLRLTAELARAQAQAADRLFREGGPVGPLTGIPAAVKDVLSVQGVEVTAGSKILAGYRPPFDATAVARLKAAGLVLVGITNCDEFAMGSSTENSGYFVTRNPHDPQRVPGGSSGGSAAAVAAGEAVYALGTDTGGSIRQPAALCGVVGMKPTYGRVSRYGLIAFASSLDQVGPLTCSVEDAALVLEAMAGVDARDATSADRPVDFLSELEAGVEGLRLGVPREYFQVEGLEPGVRSAVQEALRRLERAGAELVDVELPHTDYGLAAYYIIAPAECSSNLARMDSVRFGIRDESAPNLFQSYLRTRRAGFGPEVRRRVMLGTYALSSGYYDAYYLKAQKIRTLIAQDFQHAFRDCDAIVSATAPTVAFQIGAKVDDPFSMYLNDVLTLGGNLAGLPGISVPCGTSGGLPVGLQVLTPHWQDARALRVARAYEMVRDAA
ncbi:MAG: Asp-tRNA(Asn)/Glu-tRNA(Gln) amidotransferase subunit GatA [Candidatus Dormibacteraeota bacterium]|uniref:Glutamyl-tRNA(Gln) amidotransferase subunit A n=1 Tax=Candidatus Dormiibacter inghamiae TaxID=3127013 RepID=A0A934KER3_9BACT|nr:Asp-tRNA(Asn)/Glu-tRNA(Gln) amidotransferase subunit GatA [Candidatus Dormibacteraeota bacterium]MBJ7605404.1 Asp-tRNA(Asn)/Glu-tRNA(Gln) amidotransferase subunit GatA [Candidatus Dormibacteraeota bacterium]